ncbi:WG repeat-containing protein [Micromonospora cabrerizensis]|uniref:WG repeat-containing protein n=1 Tax=Micromonospora cabrerizensis TaxID=2911213 RepID=UPI0027E16BF9|nr:WG repeat-containing protein [Micromonospora cabrerizensis]
MSPAPVSPAAPGPDRPVSAAPVSPAADLPVSGPPAARLRLEYLPAPVDPPVSDERSDAAPSPERRTPADPTPAAGAHPAAPPRYPGPAIGDRPVDQRRGENLDRRRAGDPVDTGAPTDRHPLPSDRPHAPAQTHSPERERPHSPAQAHSPERERPPDRPASPERPASPHWPSSSERQAPRADTRPPVTPPPAWQVQAPPADRPAPPTPAPSPTAPSPATPPTAAQASPVEDADLALPLAPGTPRRYVPPPPSQEPVAPVRQSDEVSTTRGPDAWFSPAQQAEPEHSEPTSAPPSSNPVDEEPDDNLDLSTADRETTTPQVQGAPADEPTAGLTSGDVREPISAPPAGTPPGATDTWADNLDDPPSAVEPGSVEGDRPVSGVPATTLPHHQPEDVTDAEPVAARHTDATAPVGHDPTDEAATHDHSWYAPDAASSTGPTDVSPADDWSSPAVPPSRPDTADDWVHEPVSGAPVSAPPVSAPPATPVSAPPAFAPPVSAPPAAAAPVSAPPAPPAFAPPVSAPPVAAAPVSAPPAPPAFAPPVSAPPAAAAPVSAPPAPPAFAPPVSAPPVAAAPVSAPPARPVSAPPISAPPAPAVAAAPVSAPPAPAEPTFMAPVSAPPASMPPPDAAPVSAPPISSAPLPAAPVSAPPVSAPPASTMPTSAPPAFAPPVSAPPMPVSAPPASTVPGPRNGFGGDSAPVSAPPADAAPPVDAAPAATRPSLADQGDPEQVLAAYRWRLDPVTLREDLTEPDDLRAIRRRLTEKLGSAVDNRARARLLSLRAVASRILGDLDDALADGRLALTYAEATGELRRTALAQARLAHVLRWRGNFAEADQLFAQANSIELPDRLRAALHEHAGRSCYDQGRLMEACEHFEQALNLRGAGDAELLDRVRVALDAVTVRATADGFGPYPRGRDEVLDRDRPPVPDRDGPLWGYTGPDGDLVIPARYAEAQPFHDGLAWVRRPDTDRWSLINLLGTTVIPPSYRAARPFSDGLAWVVGENGWTAIDATGTVQVAPNFAEVRPFRRGLAAVRREGWGAVDRTGRIVVPTRYHGFVTELADGQQIDGFTDEGLAVVDVAGRRGVVDRTGAVLVPPTHPMLVIHPVAFLVGNDTGRWGALDRRGLPLIDPVHRDRAEVLEEIDRLLTDANPVL